MKILYPTPSSYRFLKCIFLLCLFFLPQLHAQDGGRKLFTHFNAGTSLGIYFNNKNHTEKNRGMAAGSLGVRQEWRFASGASLLVGAELFTHGVKFNSYYFADSTHFLYDKNFNYKYRIRLKEINVPVLIRANLFGKRRHETFQYFDIGPTVRVVYLSSMMLSDSTGNTVKEQNTVTNFEYYPFSKNLSVFLQLNYGILFGGGDEPGKMFLEFSARYAPVRFQISETFTAKGLYVQSLHLGVCLGIRI